jgi:hydroxypyruvate isomerase
MLGINTVRGAPGENGLSALPGREAEARAAVDQAVDYAGAVGARAIHVMAGFAAGQEAHETFIETLRYARAKAPETVTILIEPLNRVEAPDYFLKTIAQACEALTELDDDGIRLMFDCYHVGRTECEYAGQSDGIVEALLHEVRHWIGHIQFASVPDRGPPDQGELDYASIFRTIEEIEWDRPLGAEYKPQGATEDSLGWMKRL